MKFKKCKIIWYFENNACTEFFTNGSMIRHQNDELMIKENNSKLIYFIKNFSIIEVLPGE
jgi:hypothetical protein